jgi:4-amino-4-deoxy-L-arabinose transferase-like glycosyltransferase
VMILAVITAVGLIARIAYVIWMRSVPISIDGAQYHYRALALANGDGFVNPLFQLLAHSGKAPPDASQAPGWSVILAVATKLGVRSVLSQQIVSCCVGAAAIFMSGLAGRSVFGAKAGLVGAGLVAVYPNVWLYERELVSEPLAILGAATCIWLAYRFLAAPTAWKAVGLGVTIGLFALARSEEFSLLVFLLVPLLWSLRTIAWRRRLSWFVFAGIACAVVIAPWSIYNTARFHHPVALSTGLGASMSAGNCPPTYSGPLLGYYHTGVFNECTRTASSNQAVADKQLRTDAVDFMRAHLSRVPIVVAARIGRTFSVFRPFQQVHLEAERQTKLWVLRLALFSYWLLLLPAAAGLVLARRNKIRVFPLAAFPIIVVLSVAFAIGAVRYRAAAEVPLVLLAAYAISVVTSRSGGERAAVDETTGARPSVSASYP